MATLDDGFGDVGGKKGQSDKAGEVGTAHARFICDAAKGIAAPNESLLQRSRPDDQFNQARIGRPLPVAGAVVAFSASAEFVEIKLSDGSDIDAYLYKPSGKGPYPAVIVLHHSRGLTDDIKDFSNDLSGEGYVTLAVDYTTGGGFLENKVGDTYDYLQKLPKVDAHRIAMVGFSMGARLGMGVAFDWQNDWQNEYPHRPLRAFVSYYVGNTFDMLPTSDLPPILFLHGDRDPEVDAKMIVAFCDMQKQLGGICEAKILRGTTHAFIATTSHGEYDHQATVDARLSCGDALWRVNASLILRHFPLWACSILASITRLQLVRFSPKSGHWASVCLL